MQTTSRVSIDPAFPWVASQARSIVLALVFAVLAGCANKPPPDKLVVTKIALLPVTELSSATLVNENGVQFLFPIAAAAFHVDSKQKERVFSEKLVAMDLALGKELTATLSSALQKQGYRVEVLDVPRSREDPEDIDLDKIKTDADAVLHVYLEAVGLYSSKFSPDYLPRVNIRATLHSTRRDEDLYQETLYYGVDARAGKGWSIVADPKIAYPSFDAVMARLPEIGAVFANATRALGERLATEIRTELDAPPPKPKPPTLAPAPR